MDYLRDCANWKEGAWPLDENEIKAERIAERQVPSYLWKYWKSDLRREGYDWQQFQSKTSAVMPIIHRWAANQADWSEIVEKMKQKLASED